MKKYSNKEREKNTYPVVVLYIETDVTPGNITIVIGKDILRLATNRKDPEGYSVVLRNSDGSLFDFYW